MRRGLCWTVAILNALLTSTADAESPDEPGSNIQRDQQWPVMMSGSDIIGRERRCARPMAPRQGRVKIRERGKLAYFRCRRRFLLYGNPRAVCINQEWSYPPPVCVAPGCARIATSRGMTITFPGPRFRNTVLLFVCQSGFSLVGRQMVYCDGTQWSSLPPVCIEQLPTTSTTPLSSSVALSTASDSGDAGLLTTPTQIVVLSSVSSGSHASDASTTPLPTSGFTSRISSASMTSSPKQSGAPYTTRAYSTQSTTGATITISRSATATKTLPRITYDLSTHFSPKWSLPLPSTDRTFTFNKPNYSVSPGITISLETKATSTTREATTTSVLSPGFPTSTGNISVPPHPCLPTCDSITVDSIDITDQVRAMHSSEIPRRRSALWYIVGGVSCAAALAVAVMLASAVFFRRRSTAIRRYQLMDVHDDPPFSQSSGRSTFFAMQYTELKSSLDDLDQQSSSQQTPNSMPNNGCSFV